MEPAVRDTDLSLPCLCVITRRHPPDSEVRWLSQILPDELVVDILLMLPVKILLKFRCVSKSWNFLISDPQFAKKHLENSISDTKFTNFRLIPSVKIKDHERIPYPVKSLFNNPSNRVENASSPFEHNHRIVGSINGLLCLFDDELDHVFLYNPSTRLISNKSPSLGNKTWGSIGNCFMVYTFGFGYDSLSEKYKVAAVFCNSKNQTMAKVHTVGYNSWKQIQPFPYMIALSYGGCSGKFVSGSVNWIAKHTNESGNASSYNPLVLSVDMGKEICKELLLPADIQDSTYRKSASFRQLEVLKECLCYSCEPNYGTNFVVWLMKEYGVAESWTKLLDISYLDHGVIDKFRYLKPLIMSESGEVLLHTRHGGFVLYNTNDGLLKFTEVQGNMYWIDLVVYIESLVLPC